ncbi:hypothetical protein E5D57_002745 [Metarhizium anisopliae]|nr:hypothetical protein E5D57_002745 [Metarhizium anisopliae]
MALFSNGREFTPSVRTPTPEQNTVTVSHPPTNRTRGGKRTITKQGSGTRTARQVRPQNPPSIPNVQPCKPVLGPQTHIQATGKT